MRADTANGGISQLEDHYKTFIVSIPIPYILPSDILNFHLQTEKDFAEIAAAGLNYVRIPVGFWMVETRGSEQYLTGTSWK